MACSTPYRQNRIPKANPASVLSTITRVTAGLVMGASWAAAGRWPAANPMADNSEAATTVERWADGTSQRLSSRSPTSRTDATEPPRQSRRRRRPVDLSSAQRVARPERHRQAAEKEGHRSSTRMSVPMPTPSTAAKGTDSASGLVNLRFRRRPDQRRVQAERRPQAQPDPCQHEHRECRISSSSHHDLSQSGRVGVRSFGVTTSR